MACEEPLDRAEAEEQTLFGKAMPDLFDRRIPVWPQGFEDGVPMGIDPGRAPISTQGARPGVTLFALTLAPATDAGCAHLETLSRCPMRQALGNRRKHTHTQIHRQSLRHIRRLQTTDTYESDKR